MHQHTTYHDRWPATAHVLDAAAFNMRRAPQWAKVAGWRALMVSTLLISSELALVGVLVMLDLWARWLRRNNDATLLQSDFVMMENLPDIGPSAFGQKANSEQSKLVAELRWTYIKQAVAHTHRAQWPELSALTAQLIEQLEHHQHQWSVSMAMHIHLLESIGIAAHHAPEHEMRTNTKARRCIKAFLFIQLYAMLGAPMLDALAQRCHLKGAGILERDVPKIPFPPPIQD